MAARRRTGTKPKVLVSSTVYGSEDLLDLIYALLTRLGYEVWMSHKGTVPVFSDRQAFDDCIAAVDACDIVFCFITKQYGTGREDPAAMSITHRELRRAIQTRKPRWILAHHDVVFARTLLNHLGYRTAEERAALKLKKHAIIDDLRVIDMYEEATRTDVVDVAARTGNWVQKYRSNEEATLFAQAQFHRIDEVESFLKEQFGEREAVRKLIDARKPVDSGDGDAQ